MFFTKGCWCCCHAGVPIYNWKKLQLEKIKSKKGPMYKSKSKN